MNIHPMVFVHGPDINFARMLLRSLRHSLAPQIPCHPIIVKDSRVSAEQTMVFDDAVVFDQRPGFTPYPGWAHAMVKLEAYRTALQHLETEEDYLLDMDSDTIIVSRNAFDNLRAGEFYGGPHSATVRSKLLGKEWTWCSGAFMAYKRTVLQRMCALSSKELQQARNDLGNSGCAYVHDVVSSYLVELVGGTVVHDRNLFALDVEGAVLRNQHGNSTMAHFNFKAQTFAGIAVNGKHDIPRAISVLAEHQPSLRYLIDDTVIPAG